jgi:threonine dehydrogenase-like Zn-dependent dehydrogenase
MQNRSLCSSTSQTSGEIDHAVIDALSQVSLNKAAYSKPSGQLSTKSVKSIKPSDTVAIFGFGPVGLFAITQACQNGL